MPPCLQLKQSAKKGDNEVKNMSFGSKLKDMRKSRKMTQKELAEILGLSPNAISNYENAVSFPDEGILQKIFEALSCSPGDLFDVSEKEKPPPGSREAVE